MEIILYLFLTWFSFSNALAANQTGSPQSEIEEVHDEDRLALVENYLTLADYYLEKRFYKSAVKHFLNANKYIPLSTEIQLKLCIAYWGNKDFDLAINEFLKILERDPNNKVAQEYLNLTHGQKILEENRFQDALPFFEAALQINPESVYALNGISVCYLYFKNQPEEALKYIERSFKIKPNFSETYICYGLVLKELNRNEEALQALTEAAKDPTFQVGTRTIIEIHMEEARKRSPIK